METLNPKQWLPMASSLMIAAPTGVELGPTSSSTQPHPQKVLNHLLTEYPQSEITRHYSTPRRSPKRPPIDATCSHWAVAWGTSQLTPG